ncbi:MAG: adenylate/guanylate cyclase domain-containing protein [Gammaproteobacteria bacterium]
MKNERALRQAISSLQQQVASLGEAAVAAAVAPLQAQLDGLRDDGWRSSQRLRLVTIVFCDVVGSTTMARELDPEDIHTLLDAALADLSGVIENHGGRVLQYAGDSILAVFGADVSHEEDPRLAIRAGLGMLDVARQLCAKAQQSHRIDGFNIRVGIHTGRVLLGAGVDAHNSIRGMPVNIAARMEQTAPPGALRISHASFRLVRGIFNVVAQPPLAIKGVERPVRSYLVQSERDNAVRTTSRGVDGIEVRMVGREAQMDRLKDALRQLNGSSGTTPPVLVSGEAGMGKSRLADEFELWVSTREPPSKVLQAKALVQTQHQPYGLLRNFFLRWFAPGNLAETPTSDEFVRHALELVGEKARKDVSLLAHLLGLDTESDLASSLGSPRVVRERALRVATLCVERQIALTSKPLVLLLDDLHWADDDSLDWLAQILRLTANQRLLVLCVTRPQLFDRHPNWPGESIEIDKIPLDALSESACASLVEELLQRLESVPSELRDQLVTATEGNPFYLEERVKILLDEGAIVSDGDAWRLVPKRLSLTRLPDTLTGVLQARLDGLHADERRALRQAAIVGYVFWDEALAAVDSASPAQLEALERRELIVRQPSSLPGSEEFVFHHHALHQVVRDGVLKADRARYNHSVAKWLERRTRNRPEAFHGRIADHFEQAGVREEASKHYVRGAEAAAARHSRDTVIRMVERALRLVDERDLTHRWRLHLARERVMATAEDRDGHDQDLIAMLEIAEAFDDDSKRVMAKWRQAVAQSNAGSYPEALATANEAEEFAAKCEVAELSASIAAVKATALRRLNEFDAAREVAEAGIAGARACGSIEAEKELLYSLGALAAEAGRIDDSLELSASYLTLAVRSGDQTAEALGENLIGDTYYRRGDLARARQHFEASLDLASDIHYVYVMCIAALNLALVCNAQSRYVEAQSSAQRATEIAVRSGAVDLEAVALLQLGIALAGDDQLDEARSALLVAADKYTANGSGHLRVETDSALASVAMAAGDHEEALRRVEKVLAHLDAGGTLDGTEDPLRIRWHCFEVLASVQDDRAELWLTESWALLNERAAKILDPSHRDAFRKDVVHHAALAEAWRQRGTSKDGEGPLS